MQKARYDRMLQEHPAPWCWLCGLDEYSKVEWWCAPWYVERAHIVNQPRVEDRRAVVLLCSRCHGVSHGHRYPEPHPPVTRENLLWLKRLFDPEYYDTVFLQAHAIRQLQPPVPPPRRYLDARRLRRPKYAGGR